MIDVLNTILKYNLDISFDVSLSDEGGFTLSAMRWNNDIDIAVGEISYSELEPEEIINHLREFVDSFKNLPVPCE